ncbi:hypothetical protein B7P43_G06614 [Cryptotermes secundus]|uniref:Homeobox domain-containing protein n=1 Tax=Cryptotermes secundus TaxID=105785 RepID=A0A2J7QZ88_9NEOP|nr:hypothetical protein B7P43_G06614 [Cryptotermes secundus]
MKNLLFSCQGDIFSGLNDGLLSRAEALAAVDIGKHQASSTPGLPQLKHDMMYHHSMGAPHPGAPNTRPHQMAHHGMDGLDMLDPISTSTMTTLAPMSDSSAGGHGGHHPQLHGPSVYGPAAMNSMMTGHHHHHHHGGPLSGHGPPGHHALKPILQAWLEEAEAQAKNKRRDPDAPSVLPAGEKKRKRTSIAAPEKRSLEAYFAVQPRPSGEKIAAIAEKLDLKKNVVRVWFCNQRQKQKRMKFAAQH